MNLQFKSGHDYLQMLLLSHVICNRNIVSYGWELKNLGHDIYFFGQKFNNGVNEGLRWFGINLIVSFQDITQNMFCNLAKISHPADLEIC